MRHGIFQYLRSPSIAAHRGSCGGNIPPNTITAYEAALYQGADILEADVARSADGVFYMFHTGFEKFYLGIDCPFESLTSRELAQLPLNNEFGKETVYHLDRLESVLERFKGRCVINLDRSWEYWEELVPMIERLDMVNQILLKSPCQKEWIEKACLTAPAFAYMPIINEDITAFYELGGDRVPGYIGAELVFSSESSPIITGRVVDRLHQDGKIAWGNGIQFSAAKVLSAGHNDDVSVSGNPSAGWGWLIAHGFDIIQTDWVSALKLYIETLSFS